MRLPVIIVVDCDEAIRNFLMIRLRKERYQVLTGCDGKEGLSLAQANHADLVVSEIVLPEMDGIRMLQEIRFFSKVPLIFLTEKDDDACQLRAFNYGADDYVIKPFNPEILCARIRAAIDRVKPINSREAVRPYKRDDVCIDFVAKKISRDGRDVRLSRTEWTLLEMLARNAGKVLTHKQLLTDVWGPEFGDDLQYLRVWIARVRSRIGMDMIITLPRVGYQMAEPA